MSTTTRRPSGAVMDDRIRQRRLEVRRARGRRRHRVVVAVLVAVAMAVAGVAVTRSPLFAITAVRVQGVDGRHARVVKRVAGIVRGHNMIGADFGQALEGIRSLPWVAAAGIRREPPSTVVIEVTPRRPVAIVSGIHGRWTVDAHGVVVGRARGRQLPTIDVTSTDVPVPGTPIADAAAANALKLHSRLPDDVRRAALAVEAVGARTVRVELALHRLEDPAGYGKGKRTWVRLGDAADVTEQVAVLRALLAQLRTAKAGVPAEVDVRVPGNPVVVP